MEIDLNADLGEGSAFDAELMQIVTSANVCCGLHAGSPAVSRECLELARVNGVAVGAHPGYADREHYGRRELNLSVEEVWGWCAFEIGGLIGLATAEDVEVRYVKPHGALYNQAASDRELAQAIVLACSLYQLPLVGLPGTALEEEARGTVEFIPEGFADRRYRADGTLVPRSEPGAFVHDPDEAVAQVDRLIRESGVRTICVHGDNPDAVAFAKGVRAALVVRGYTLKAFA